MADELTQSNAINIGILTITALVGLLAWLGARQAAQEARSSEDKARKAAERIASAAEDAAGIHKDMLRLERLRHVEATLDAKRARLHAGKTIERELAGLNEPEEKVFLTIRNSGQSSACNLDIHVNGRPIGDCGNICPLRETTCVGAGESVKLKMILYWNVGDLRLPFDVSLAWDDESGIRGNWLGTIT